MQYQRLKTEHHVNDMITLGKVMHEESEYRDFDFSPEKLARLGERIMTNKNIFAEGAYAEGLVGMIVGQISEYWFGTDRIASDTVWYVHPDHRGSMAGIRLLTHFADWAENQGVKEISVGVSSGINTDRAGALLNRIGFNSVGGLYKRRIA